MNALVFGFLCLAGGGGTTAVEETWPQWRGPTGDSIAPARALPVHWTKTENIAWKFAFPGWGNSTPAIWGDAIFLTTQDKDRLLLLRLDGKTGKVVWERQVGKGTTRTKQPGRYHEENNMASPSPVTDGRHVWVHFGTGDFACYDFAGEQVWSVSMTERYGLYSIWWGHANSPCLFGDLLISACMQDPKGGGKSYVVAMDKATGTEKWFVLRATGAKEEPADAYTTPMLYRHDGRVDLIVLGGQVLDAYDPASGKQLWQCKPFSAKGNRVIPSPTIAGDTIYAVEGMKGPLFAVRAGGEDAGDVTATNVLWKHKGNTPDAASPVVVNGLVFLVSNDGFAVCLDAKTGKNYWTERLEGEFRATPLVAGNNVYFISKAGNTTIIGAAQEFKLVAQCNLDEVHTIASPAAAGGSLYIRTKAYLYRIGVSQ